MNEGESMQYKFDHKPTAKEIKKPPSIIYLIILIIVKFGMMTAQKKFLRMIFPFAITMAIIILLHLKQGK